MSVSIPTPEYFKPWQNVIEGISRSNPAVVGMVRPHGYSDGLVVRLIVPKQCGMPQLNNKTFDITVRNPFDFSIPVDTRAFDPFVTINPALIATYPYLAQALPTGDTNLSPTQAMVNNNNIIPELYVPTIPPP